MGVNNRARRAAKRRRQQARTSGVPGGHTSGFREPSNNSLDETERAARLLSEALISLRCDPASAEEQAQRLTRDITGQHLAPMLHRALTELTVAVVRHGWTPNDVGEITRRRLSVRHLPLIAALITEETRRHPTATVSAAWLTEVESLGRTATADLTDVSGVAQALEVLLLFGQLPRLPRTMSPPGSRQDVPSGGDSAQRKMLARVRALLAKAESTDFPEESEALSTKAQELISAYALHDLAAQVDAGAPAQPMGIRRIWVDAPYVSAKSMLVHAVAEANHCSSVFSKHLGFVTLVGRPADADATELLVTSLLVQADRALLLHRGDVSTVAASRTTSFRRSFLISYAGRIGERLEDAAADTLATSGRSGELVPVIAHIDEQVQAATDELFPHLVRGTVRISNARGWAAGRAAADLAVFSVNDEISEHAAG